MSLFENSFYWGPKDSDLAEIPLTPTNYRGTISPLVGWLVANQHYHIFEPGSVAPGIYEWSWELRHPWIPGVVEEGSGEVHVVPG
jgi:hypothetical protein